MTVWFHGNINIFESMSHTIVYHGPVSACLMHHEISTLHPDLSLMNVQLCKSTFSKVSDSHTDTHTHVHRNTHSLVSAAGSQEDYNTA